MIQNAQLLASGFLVYLVYYYLFADHMHLGWKLVEACYKLVTLNHLFALSWQLRHFLAYLAILLAAGLPVLLVHLFLWMAYRKGYESRNALTVLFGLPLVVISFLLPFLKILGAFDGAAFTDAGHGAIWLQTGSTERTVSTAPGTDTLPQAIPRFPSTT